MKGKNWTSLDINEVSLVSAGANQPAKVSLLKSAEPEEELNMEKKTPPVEPDADDKDKVKAKKSEDVTAIEKAFGEKFAALEARLAESDAKLAKSDAARASVEKALAVTKKAEFVSSTLKSIPADTAFAEKLVELEASNTDLSKYFVEMLTKCSELISKSALLKQVSTGAPAAPAGSAIEKAELLIKQKLTENPKLGPVKAEAEVWQENPRLYAQYNAEQAQA